MAIYALDSARPFLTISGLPVQWHTGSAALWASTSLTRINAHGVAFKPWRPRAGLADLGWLRAPCPASAYGLCDRNGSVVFPSAQTPLVGQGGDCGGTTARGIVNTASRYDPSACDVLDAGRDYVLAGGVLFVREGTALPLWAYWTVAALVVFLVRCLSKYVLASLQAKADYPNPALCIGVCAACAVLVCLPGDAAFVTREDRIFYWLCVAYIIAYGSLFVGTRALAHVQRAARQDPPFYNLLAGVLQLVACRLYSGAETPYNPPLLFIVATRAFVKSRRGADFLRSLTLLFDAVFLGLGCSLGFSPEPLYLIALFTAGFAGADVLL
jgi:hypothetical protein